MPNRSAVVTMVHLEHFKDFCWGLIDSKLQLLIDQMKVCVLACVIWRWKWSTLF